MTAPVLEVRDLNVIYESRRGPVTALTNVSFDLGRERLGIVGESGSGKSTLGRALMRLLPESARLWANRMNFEGTDLITASNKTIRSLRGRKIAMIQQDAHQALNPVMSVGAQITESYRLHRRIGRGEARQQGLQTLAQVRIDDAERVWRAYPHELSGGLAQRVVIAMMLAARPDVLIADEPTSALDVLARQSVLELLDELTAERGMAILMISHDLSLVSTFCDRVLIMRDGAVVDEVAALALERSTHPYTQSLLADRPKLEAESWRAGLANR